MGERGSVAGAMDEPTQPPVETTLTTPPTLLTRKRLLPLLFAFALVALVVWKAPVNWGEAWHNISHANLGLYIVAILVYYSSMFIRGFRWRILLENAGDKRKTLHLVVILMNAYFANAVLPARLGDVYRALLTRSREKVSGARAIGTILAERLLDVGVLMAMLLLSGYITIGRNVPTSLTPYLVGGGMLLAAGIAIIVTLAFADSSQLEIVWRFVPDGLRHKYDTFRHGTVHAYGRWELLIPSSVIIWSLEGGRLTFVVLALGLFSHITLTGILFVALVEALLTTIPFLPGGLGLVETGMATVLAIVAHMTPAQAISVTLLDRSISYGSLVIIGGVIVILTHLTTSKSDHAALEAAQANP